MKREDVKNKIPGITEEQLNWLMQENGSDITREKFLSTLFIVSILFITRDFYPRSPCGERPGINPDQSGKTDIDVYKRQVCRVLPDAAACTSGARALSAHSQTNAAANSSGVK